MFPKFKLLSRFISVKNIYLIILSLIALGICARYTGGLSSYLLISVSVYLIGISLISALTNNYKLGFSLASSIIIILEIFNRFKKIYYKERLLFQDYNLIIDPSNINILFQYPTLLIAFIFIIIFLLFNIYLYYKEYAFILKNIYLNIGLNLIISFSLLFSLYIYLNNNHKILVDNWINSMPWGKGTIANLVMSARNVEYTPPIYNEDPNYFLSKTNAIKANVAQLNSKPDVVILLQESTFDPLFFDLKEPHNIPQLDMFQQGIHGQLRVQTYGGATWISEFALLAGLNPADFGVYKSAVFYVVAEHIKNSLFKQFADNGYEIIVLNPSDSAYNADEAYTYFGMQQFVTPQDFGFDAQKDDARWHLPTAQLLEYAKQMLLAKKDKPRLIYITSIAEHGRYNKLSENKYNLQEKIPHKLLFELNDYTDRIVTLNSATLDFIDYLKKRDDKTLFFYFGDHQPAIEHNKNFKIPFDNQDYISHFALVTNYSNTKQKIVLADLSLTSGLIVEQAGIKPNDFYVANIKMRHACNWLLDDCKDKKLINSYKSYLYNTLKAAGEKTK